jgi:phosphate transport system substrate-binding protein
VTRAARWTVGLLILAACAPESGGGDGLQGAVVIDGSSTVFPVAEAVAEAFQERHPRVRVTVGFSGTGGGFERFCRGETHLETASRPIEVDEAALCTDNGVSWIELPVAFDGISLAVNPRADFVECLTIEELRRIWEPGSGIGNWRQIRPSFPDLALRLYGAGTASGTFDHFTEAVTGEEGLSRIDYQASEDDNVLVQGVIGDEGGLAYFGYAYVVENMDRLSALGIDAGQGCVTPSPETITDRSYPLSRSLYVYLRTSALEEPQVAAFAEFLLASAARLVPRTGYLPLEEERYASLLEELRG